MEATPRGKEPAVPCRYHNPRRGVLVCVFEGKYTLAETLAVFRQGLDDPGSEGGVDVIIDITGSQAVKTIEQFRRVVQDLSRHDRFAGRIAVVARANDPLRYGLSRQFSALTSLDGVPMEVHGSMSAAQAWLARDPELPDDEAATQ